MSTDSARGSRDSRGPLVVRPAEAEDAPSIALVHTRSWQGAYRGLVPAPVLDALDVDARTVAWRRILEDAPAKGQTVLVAQSDEGLVGFATGGPCRDDDEPASSELYAIYALPSSWGTGVGMSLMLAMLERLHAHVNAVSLWVIRENTRARQFYASCGFADDGAERVEVLGGAEVGECRMVRRPG